MKVYGNAAVGFAFGAFGASPELFPGGPAFVGGDDAAIFSGTNAGFLQSAASIGYNFIPPTAIFLRSVGDKWQALKQSISTADQSFLEKKQAQLGAMLNSFFSAVSNHSAFGYSQDAQRQVIEAANNLKRALVEISQYKMQPEIVITDQIITGVQKPIIGSGQQPSTMGPMSTAPVSTGSSWIMPVAIGGGVLVVGVLIFALTRKKKTAMAGYRRRRIRR